ncbi:MAG: hypothetical protein KJ950_03590 [Proteobacteria bacterium]|nr:hypothetical protein [Pseudomonadota bacterium]MBU1686402.1 hypothetical protein [Pseudomonadota bacterium]
MEKSKIEKNRLYSLPYQNTKSPVKPKSQIKKNGKFKTNFDMELTLRISRQNHQKALITPPRQNQQTIEIKAKLPKAIQSIFP